MIDITIRMSNDCLVEAMESVHTHAIGWKKIIRHLVTDKKTRETYYYTPPDESGYAICAKVGDIRYNGLKWVSYNIRGERIRDDEATTD